MAVTLREFRRPDDKDHARHNEAVKLTRRQFTREDAGDNSYSSSHVKELDKRAAYLKALDHLGYANGRR